MSLSEIVKAHTTVVSLRPLLVEMSEDKKRSTVWHAARTAQSRVAQTQLPSVFDKSTSKIDSVNKHAS